MLPHVDLRSDAGIDAAGDRKRRSPSRANELDRTSLQRALPARSARNALDCALWDLEAKLARRSIWDLTGLDEPSTISSDVTIGIFSPDDTAARAEGFAMRR